MTVNVRVDEEVVKLFLMAREKSKWKKLKKAELQTHLESVCGVCLSLVKEKPDDTNYAIRTRNISQMTQLGLVDQCHHPFHASCILSWCRRSRFCPLCKNEFEECAIFDESTGNLVKSNNAVVLHDNWAAGRAGSSEESDAVLSDTTSEEESFYSSSSEEGEEDIEEETNHEGEEREEREVSRGRERKRGRQIERNEEEETQMRIRKKEKKIEKKIWNLKKFSEETSVEFADEWTLLLNDSSKSNILNELDRRVEKRSTRRKRGEEGREKRERRGEGEGEESGRRERRERREKRGGRGREKLGDAEIDKILREKKKKDIQDEIRELEKLQRRYQQVATPSESIHVPGEGSHCSVHNIQDQILKRLKLSYQVPSDLSGTLIGRGHDEEEGRERGERDNKEKTLIEQSIEEEKPSLEGYFKKKLNFKPMLNLKPKYDNQSF